MDRCVNDADLPLEVRAAGALVLLFGVTIHRVLHLTATDLDQSDGLYLPLGSKPVLLPPRLAHLVRELADSPRGRSAISRSGRRAELLFPGRTPGRSAIPYAFTRKLKTYGITIPEARNSGRRALATTLPAPIIADLSGMHIDTAVHWTHLTRRDWTDYVTDRALQSDSQNPAPESTR